MKTDDNKRDKPKSRYKTYTPGSHHNIYSANLVGLGTRVDRILKRKIEVYAKANGLSISDATRLAIEEKFGNVVLSTSDYELIESQTQEQEERNARKIAQHAC